MTGLAEQLIALGFRCLDDFVCQDDSDGRGPYIREWKSDQLCPFPEAVRAPILTPLPSDSPPFFDPAADGSGQ